jgi:hypothetical protein
MALAVAVAVAARRRLVETEPDLAEQELAEMVEKVLPIHFAPTRQLFTDQVAVVVVTHLVAQVEPMLVTVVEPTRAEQVEFTE